jgi:UDP-N-acetylmuramate dehydrogenase
MATHNKENYMNAYSALRSAFEKEIASENIICDAPMSNFTSFRIGGPADLLITPSSEHEIRSAFALAKRYDMPITLIGNGSNILVSDAGIRGVVICISQTYNSIRRDDNKIIAHAGALLSTLSNFALAQELSGLEFASGIPGTLGGAVFMNAGAYGGEIKDVIHSIKVLTPQGEVIHLEKRELLFNYRTSNIQSQSYVVLEVVLELHESTYDDIKTVMDDLNLKRTSKQPLHLPSAGSTFKRPEGYFAGKLIEDAGLRGIRYGGAQVSELHCGFVVNIDQASCQDVMLLIQTIQKVVRDRFNVVLEPEVRMLGEGFK